MLREGLVNAERQEGWLTQGHTVTQLEVDAIFVRAANKWSSAKTKFSIALPAGHNLSTFALWCMHVHLYCACLAAAQHATGEQEVTDWPLLWDRWGFWRHDSEVEGHRAYCITFLVKSMDPWANTKRRSVTWHDLFGGIMGVLCCNKDCTVFLLNLKQKGSPWV